MLTKDYDNLAMFLWRTDEQHVELNELALNCSFVSLR